MMVITNVYIYQKYLELDTPRVNFTPQWKISILHKICSVPGSTQSERQGRAQSGPARFQDQVHNRYTLASEALSPSLLVPEVSSCGAVAATWGRNWRVMSEETGKSWKICLYHHLPSCQ